MRTQVHNGQRRFILGPVELVVAALLPTMLLAIMGMNWSATIGTIAKQGETIQEMSKNVVSMQEQIRYLTILVADVPTLRTKVAEMDMRLNRDREDIIDLQSRVQQRQP